MRALRKLRRDYPKDVFERGEPNHFTASSSASARLPRCLSRSTHTCCAMPCGFKLANDGHDTRALQHYLGHKNIQHTVRYTEMAPDRFKDFWRGY